MKQTEYTSEQELVLGVLKKLENEIYTDYHVSFSKNELRKKIDKVKESYGIKEKHLTLREYLAKHSCGAYNTFTFRIDTLSIKVCNVIDFEKYYISSLLDKYYVVSENVISRYGGSEPGSDYTLELSPIEQ